MVTNSDNIKAYYKDTVILKYGISTDKGGQINQKERENKREREWGVEGREQDGLKTDPGNIRIKNMRKGSISNYWGRYRQMKVTKK